MKLAKILSGLLVLIINMTFLVSCGKDNFDYVPGFGREPIIEPDYSGVIIPYNIAPMNFIISEEGELFKIRIISSTGTQLNIRTSDGIVRIPEKKWRKLLLESQGKKIKIEILSESKAGGTKKFDPLFIYVANEPVDPYICYRLLFPGYESYGKMKIVQRSTEGFTESSLFENQLLEDNCVNCHSFLQNNPDRFLLHVRGSLAGTYFINDKVVIRRELKTQMRSGNLVFPSWHPTGKFVAFSSDKIYSVIHMHPEENIEFYELSSRLVIYNIDKNEMSFCSGNDTIKYIETFPFWSPDGKYLYYCRTDALKPGFNYKQINYDLLRVRFDQGSGVFGNSEVIFNAHALEKSASLPVISPDGKYLVFTLHDYGIFPVWHKEADLYILNLQTGKFDKMSLNSNETESYHSWSSNGRWMIFSSKRGDGLTARPYLAYFGSPDSVGKPFILPQKDPLLYERMVMTFNRPEFITGKIKIGPRNFARASKRESVKAIWTEKIQ
jgi:WD40 repeat protein